MARGGFAFEESKKPILIKKEEEVHSDTIKKTHPFLEKTIRTELVAEEEKGDKQGNFAESKVSDEIEKQKIIPSAPISRSSLTAASLDDEKSLENEDQAALPELPAQDWPMPWLEVRQ